MSVVTSRQPAVAVAIVTALAVLLGACGSSGSTPAATSSVSSGHGTVPTTQGSTPETNPAGDIPDGQAFVPYRGAGFTVGVPEGWARSSVGGGVLFADKLNSARIARTASPTRPTVESVRTTPGSHAGRLTTVTRTAGPAVLLTYQAQSAPNSVTGKAVAVSVEQYLFWRAGALVTITLTSPLGADNVDPWRKVTDSFRWL